MIEITEAKHGFLCQVCCNNEGVKEINFHAKRTGVIVRLCKSCRNELISLLMAEIVRSRIKSDEWKVDGIEIN